MSEPPRGSKSDASQNSVESTPSKRSDEPMIRASGLCKHYGDVRAVQDVGFEIHRGEIVGFLGPNGAGKSTTMKMLTGYLVPDSGEVLVGGDPIVGAGLEARARIGYLPEHTPLYRGMRVDRYLEFVARMRGLARAERKGALERVIERCDLEGYTSRRIQTLSKGYRQRVGLAQALIADPEVLILDEPTSGLDPAEIVRIRDLVIELATDKTILLSTHILPEVEEVCRRALILAGGKLVADGDLLALTGEAAERLSVTLTAPGADVAEAMQQIKGVKALLGQVQGGEQRVRYQLEVENRFAVAERIAKLVRKHDWRLLELRHESATLEQVFLKHTRGLDAAKKALSEQGARTDASPSGTERTSNGGTQ